MPKALPPGPVHVGPPRERMPGQQAIDSSKSFVTSFAVPKALLAQSAHATSMHLGKKKIKFATHGSYDDDDSDSEEDMGREPTDLLDFVNNLEASRTGDMIPIMQQQARIIGDQHNNALSMSQREAAPASSMGRSSSMSGGALSSSASNRSTLTWGSSDYEGSTAAQQHRARPYTDAGGSAVGHGAAHGVVKDGQYGVHEALKDVNFNGKNGIGLEKGGYGMFGAGTMSKSGNLLNAASTMSRGRSSAGYDTAVQGASAVLDGVLSPTHSGTMAEKKTAELNKKVASLCTNLGLTPQAYGAMMSRMSQHNLIPSAAAPRSTQSSSGQAPSSSSSTSSQPPIYGSLQSQTSTNGAAQFGRRASGVIPSTTPAASLDMRPSAVRQHASSATNIGSAPPSNDHHAGSDYVPSLLSGRKSGEVLGRRSESFKVEEPPPAAAAGAHHKKDDLYIPTYSSRPSSSNGQQQTMPATTLASVRSQTRMMISQLSGGDAGDDATAASGNSPNAVVGGWGGPLSVSSSPERSPAAAAAPLPPGAAVGLFHQSKAGVAQGKKKAVGKWAL